MVHTSPKTWAQGNVFWSGSVKAGSHAVWLQSPTASAWGCGADYGALSVTVIPTAYTQWKSASLACSQGLELFGDPMEGRGGGTGLVEERHLRPGPTG